MNNRNGPDNLLWPNGQHLLGFAFIECIILRGNCFRLVTTNTLLCYPILAVNYGLMVFNPNIVAQQRLRNEVIENWNGLAIRARGGWWRLYIYVVIVTLWLTVDEWASFWLQAVSSDSSEAILRLSDKNRQRSRCVARQFRTDIVARNDWILEIYQTIIYWRRKP